MEDFNPDLLLPQELTIDSVDEHLYRIGLCLTPNRHNTRRSLIFHPILITIMSIIFIILRIASIFTDNQEILLLMGDVGQLFKMRIYVNIFLILTTSFIFSNQLIYYYNNNRDIRPTFLTLFHMMSGSVSPSSIGLTDEHQVTKLLSLSRKLFIIVKYQCQYVLPICVGIVLLPTYIMSTSVYEVLLYGIPTILIYLIIELHLWNFFSYLYLYFYLVCKYLNVKLKNLNEKLILIRDKKYNCKIALILNTFNAIYCEIKEYDSTYISKFLFTVWLVVDTSLVILIYLAVFISSQLIVRLGLYYATIVFGLIFINTIITAASINYNCRKTYKLLNSLYQRILKSKPKHNKFRYGKYLARYKVNFESNYLLLDIVFLIKLISYRNSLKEWPKEELDLHCGPYS